MNIGYARVSTSDQVLDLQMDALNAVGCTKIFTDVCSGRHTTPKPGFISALDYMRAGDCLIVWKLDRMCRSLRTLIDIINNLNNKGMFFKSLQEDLNTNSTAGKLIFHVFGALAEFEHDVIRDRCHAGLVAARARGRFGGRPRKVNDSKIVILKSLLADRRHSISDICKSLKISRATLYRYAKINTIELNPTSPSRELRNFSKVIEENPIENPSEVLLSQEKN